MCVHVHVKPEVHGSCFSQSFFTSFLWDSISHWPWCLPFWLVWLAGKPQGSSLLLSTGKTDHSRLFKWVLGVWPQALYEPSLWSLNPFFSFPCFCLFVWFYFSSQPHQVSYIEVHIMISWSLITIGKLNAEIVTWWPTEQSEGLRHHNSYLFVYMWKLLLEAVIDTYNSTILRSDIVEQYKAALCKWLHLWMPTNMRETAHTPLNAEIWSKALSSSPGASCQHHSLVLYLWRTIIFESHSWAWWQDTIPWHGRWVPTDKARAEPVRGCVGCKLWETCVSWAVCQVECSRKLKNWQMSEKTSPTIFHISFCILRYFTSKN